MAITELELKGSARARGKTHGAAVSKLIAGNVDTYFARYRLGGLDDAGIAAAADRWAQFIEADSPEYFEEIQGISEGAGIGLKEITALNVRYELAYAVMRREIDPRRSVLFEADGCTSFGIMPEASAGQRTLVGQNWDWLTDLRGRMVVSRVRGDDGSDFVGLHEAGIAGCKMGVSRAGIGFVINGLVTPDDGKNGLCTPLHVRCQRALATSRFDKAIEAFISTPRTCSSNILIGHADGEIINLEVTPDRFCAIYPRDGLVTHANHIVGDLPERSMYEQTGAHTLFRGVRLERLLKQKSGQLEIGNISACLADRFGAPSGICREPDPSVPQARRTATVAAVLIDLTKRVLYVSDGSPHENLLNPFPLNA